MTKLTKRIRRVEKDPAGGWIARKRDGSEVLADFRWNSRGIARAVVYESDVMDDSRAALRKDAP